MDKAHKWTEEQINELLRKFKEVYGEAQIISAERLGEHLNQFEKQDLEKESRLQPVRLQRVNITSGEKRKSLSESGITTP